MSLDFNAYSKENQLNPYPAYDRLRRESPVYYGDWGKDGKFWVLTRYEDIDGVLRNAKDFPNSLGPGLKGMTDDGRPFLVLNGIDPPDHTRIRRVIAPFFTPRAVESKEPLVRDVCNDVINSILASGNNPFDLIAEYANPIASAVIFDMLGVPVSLRERYKAWTEDYITVQGGQGGEKEKVNFRDFYDDAFLLMEERRRNPGPDLISVMVKAVDDEGLISEQEAHDNVMVMFVAGMETTEKLIGNAVVALVQNPDEYAKVLEDRSLIGSLIEETLRYDTSAVSIMRTAALDVEIGGQLIRRGERLMLVLGSAGRDPDQFPDPDRFDVERSPNDHIGFGEGPHACPGMWLARIETRVAVETLLDRMPSLSLDPGQFDESNRLQSTINRGFLHLEVQFDPALVSKRTTA
ncbi:MAG: cytochrome P450 [Chloroflexi bacterium]|nr:cytochrome P450 [Chloroflexota bacterium]